MRELLIRYLLGELDADEHRSVHEQLQRSPELRAELARLRSCFAAHEDDDDFTAGGPPRGLASRTAQRVIGGDDTSGSNATREEVGLSSAGDSPSGILGWSLADLTVAFGVILAVSMLLFPALRNSRDGTRRSVCQYNLSQLWTLAAKYAEDNGRVYPEVGPNECAGSFVARLIAKRYAQPEEIAVFLVCPGGAVADAIRSKRFTLRMPTAEQLAAMSPSQLAQFTATASPCYSYRFPYLASGKICYVREEQLPLSPVFADTIGDDPSVAMSPNHSGSVIQVQFDDGRTLALTSTNVPGTDDDMFHNLRGLVGVGLDRQDSVLGPSNAKPGY